MRLITLIRILSDKRFIAGLLACALLAGVVLYLGSQSDSKFSAEYAAYAELAKTQETAAYLPAAPDNPVREQLNLMLSLVLEKNTSASARLSDAQQGLDLLKQLNTQIDAIGDVSEKANIAIAKMQVESLKNFGTSGQTNQLIDLAKQRSTIIEDIRGLSYRADFETGTILQRIIDDKGELTSAHIVDINSEIPDVETQFDHRSSLYAQLESVSAEITQRAGALPGSYALTAGQK